MAKLTKKVREALEWFDRQPGPVKLFGANDPSRQIIKRLADAGYLRRDIPAAFGMIGYQITPAGRTALVEGE